MKRWSVLLVVAVLAGCAPRYADDAVVRTVRALRPSIVLLTMTLPPERRGGPPDVGFATAFVVASGAWGSDLLTAQHAIDGASNFHAIVDNRSKAAVRVIAANADLDIALLRTPQARLPVVPLGNSTHLEDQVGREVVLLGYPVPDDFQDSNLTLATSMAAGYLSSVRNDQIELMLPVVPGESGAPIFLADTGEIIGVANSRFDDERSIGFALPIGDAKRFLHQVDRIHGF